jgi:hypothetical protein
MLISTNTKEILKIDFASHRIDRSDPTKLSGTGSTAPHPVKGDSLLDGAGRDRIRPSMEEHNFLPDLIKEERKARCVLRSTLYSFIISLF